MSNQASLTSRPRVVTRERPLHLRLISHPVSRREAEQIFARQQVAEAFGRLCA